LLSPDTRSGLDLVDRGADTAAGFGVSPTTGHGASTSMLSPERRSTARTERSSNEKKVFREEGRQLQLQECLSQQDFTGAEACKQKLGKLSLPCYAETLQNQGAEVTDREQYILPDERGSKRGRNLSKHPSAEVTPPKKVHRTAGPDLHQAAAKAIGHGSPLITGNAKNDHALASVAMETMDHGWSARVGCIDYGVFSAAGKVFGYDSERGSD